MTRRLVIGGFATEDDLLHAVKAARENGWSIVDAYTPHAVHGLEDAMGLRPSRLPWVCFAFGFAGVVLAMWFQYWVSAVDWPINKGGRPLNSWPAFVPVAFEMLVLLAGFGVVFAFFVRSKLRPGKKPDIPIGQITDNQFALVVESTGPDAEPALIRDVMNQNHAVLVEEREEGVA